MELEQSIRDVSTLLADAKSRWRRGEKLDAREWIDQHPEVAWRKTLVLDIAYEEFCQRWEQDRGLSIESFLGRFPSLRNSLRRQIEVHQYVADRPDNLASGGEPDWPSAEEEVFGFHVREELGRGSFARVYLCTQPSLGQRQVVVKISLAGAFEADLLGRLRHPFIMPVHSVQQDDFGGATAICMPFRGRSTLCDVLDRVCQTAKAVPRGATVILEAARQWVTDDDRYDEYETAAAWLRKGSYVTAVVRLGIQLAEALEHAHQQGIVHGDLKPSNILLTPSGRPQVLDFNLAREERAATSVPGGTLPYMSPEQLQSLVAGLDEPMTGVDRRADIYSLGATLYELLCGQLPFVPPTRRADLRKEAQRLLAAQSRGPRPLANENPLVGRRLDGCVEACLHFDPAARPASMADLAAELRRCLSPVSRLRRWIRAHRGQVAVLVLLMATTIFGVASYLAGRAPYHIRAYQGAQQQFQQQRWSAVITDLDRAIQAQPDFAEAYFLRGRARMAINDLAGANHDFERANRQQPDGQFAAAHAEALCRLEFFEHAANLYYRAIDGGFSNHALFNNLGYCELKSGSLDRARTALDRGIGIRQDRYPLFLNRAMLTLRLAQESQQPIPDQGIDDIERALKLAPPNGELYLLAARIHALAFTRDTEPSDPDPGYVESGLDHLAQACRLGFLVDHNALQEDPDFASLRADPRFRSIVASKRDARPDPLSERLLDPFQAESQAPRAEN